jgi:hypothetical protein
MPKPGAMTTKKEADKAAAKARAAVKRANKSRR